MLKVNLDRELHSIHSGISVKESMVKAGGSRERLARPQQEELRIKLQSPFQNISSAESSPKVHTVNLR